MVSAGPSSWPQNEVSGVLNELRLTFQEARLVFYCAHLTFQDSRLTIHLVHLILDPFKRGNPDFVPPLQPGRATYPSRARKP